MYFFCDLLLFFCVWLVSLVFCVFFFFFSSRRRHTRCLSDWSSDVCSSDLGSLDYDQTVSMMLPPGFNVSRKPAPVAYTADFGGVTAYGEAHGHVEVAGDAIDRKSVV